MNSHKYVCVLLEGKKWPKSFTNTENISCADLCGQICADNNSVRSAIHNHSIWLIIDQKLLNGKDAEWRHREEKSPYNDKL